MMLDVKAREVALEIIAILTGKRMGQPPSDQNRFHTLHSIAAGESTIAAISLAMEIAVPIQHAMEEAYRNGWKDSRAKDFNGR